MPCIYSFNGEQQPVGPHLPLLSQFKDQLIWSKDVLSDNDHYWTFLFVLLFLLLLLLSLFDWV